MDRVLNLTSFDEELAANRALEFWLSRPPEERIAEVERLRREYWEALGGAERHGVAQGLPRSLRIVEREQR
jgi:hypothetical protein